jgi:hypothetical protein
MKVEKTIDPQEESMEKVFDALTKHLKKYPNDFATLYVGQNRERDGKDMIDHNMFIFENNEQHFLKSVMYNFYTLMEYAELEVFKNLHDEALEIYNEINEL